MPKNRTIRQIDLRPGGGATAAVVTGGGGGMTVVTDHGALTGLGDDDHTQYHTDARGDLRYVPLARTVTAGSGLTGGGALSGDITLNVGAGNGITVNANDVALASSAAGAGLTYSAGVLDVGAGNGLTVSADAVALTTPGTLSVGSSNSAVGNHTHAMTSSSNPGAAASILASDASGFLTLQKLTTPVLASAAGLSVVAVGDITIDAGGADVIFDYDDVLRSDNYAAGFPLAGFRLGPTSISGQTGMNIGALEADELRARIFVADLTRVDQGQEYITKGYGILSRPFTVPASVGSTATIYFENSPHLAGALFTANDWVLLRYLDLSSGFTLTSVWGQVTAYASVSADEQSWTFTLRSGTGGLAFKKGATVTGFGASGQGYILSDAVSSTSPSVTIGKWATNPYTPANRTVHAAMGRLDALGFSGEYGFAATKDNFTASGTWWKASSGGVAQNNVDSTWNVAGTQSMQMSGPTGLWFQLAATAFPERAVSWYNGAQVGASLYAQNQGTSAYHTHLVSYYRGLGFGGTLNLRAEGGTGATQGGLVHIEAGGAENAAVDAVAGAAGTSYVLAGPRLHLAVAGTAASPALALSSVSNTGLYWDTGSLNASVGGTREFSLTQTLAHFYGALEVDGATTLATLGVTGATTLSSTLSVGGSVTLSSTLAVTGAITTNGGMLVGNAVVNDAVGVTVGANRTGNGTSVLDFVGAASDITNYGYSFRFARNSGANAASVMVHRGTGAFWLSAAEAAPILLRTTDTMRMTIAATGEVGIGKTPASGWALDVNGHAAVSGAVVAAAFRVGADSGGAASHTTLTNATQGINTGITAVRYWTSSNSAVNSGWMKVYIGTAVKWIPYWDN